MFFGGGMMAGRYEGMAGRYNWVEKFFEEVKLNYPNPFNNFPNPFNQNYPNPFNAGRYARRDVDRINLARFNGMDLAKLVA